MTRLSMITLFLGLFAISACNTIQGVGKDVQSGGKAITNASENVEEEIKTTY